jgi:hypothetical protein
MTATKPADDLPTLDRHGAGHSLALSAWCVVAAFGTYFCMYAFRKPFTAAAYTDISLAGIDYKTVLVTAQVLGYTVSKFLGIKFVAERRPEQRAGFLLALIGVAELALLLFGIIPPPYNFACLFLNGLPLGMVFSLVLGFLEGRRVTEALTAALCASFILADGVTRSVGAYLLQACVDTYWMPFTTGLLFLPPLLLCVWMLTRIPAPSAADIAARSERAPMNRDERRRFFGRYAVGLSLLVLAFLLITVLRSIRADFALEIWEGLGMKDQPSVFAESETLVALGVLLLSGLAVFVRDNGRAFALAMGLAVAGLVLIGVAVLGWRAGWLEPFAFMVLLGCGLYLPYVVVHTTLFERLIAMTRDRGNLGYLMCLADAFGYLGYVAVMLARNVHGAPQDFLGFFLSASGVIAVASLVALVLCWWYFSLHPATAPALQLRPARA